MKLKTKLDYVYIENYDLYKFYLSIYKLVLYENSFTVIEN